jgi:hypothetical protein
VRLKSSEAVTLKAALKKTIGDAMAMAGGEEDEDEDDEMQIDRMQDVSAPVTWCREMILQTAL